MINVFCYRLGDWEVLIKLPRFAHGPTEEAALIAAELELRTALDDVQARLTTERTRVKAASEQGDGGGHTVEDVTP